MGKAIYDQIYQSKVFVDWSGFDKRRCDFEGLIKPLFNGEINMKLIGSAATKTMRRGAEDMDYFVSFENSFNQEDFVTKIRKSGVEITDINAHKKYGYLRLSGRYQCSDFVLVPVVDPHGEISTYEQDAFYHSDFINSRKAPDHTYNAVLSKEFFQKAGVYKRVKGIGVELLTLHYGNFDTLLEAFASSESIRVNFSENDADYSHGKLIIDYPFLGGRSFTEKVSDSDFERIKQYSKEVRKSPRKMLA